LSKRIVFCADGTWDGTSNNTNVFKLFNSMLTTADQVPYYDNGVGADGDPIEHLLGGAFGLGLFQKIKDGYTKIAQVYEAGDEIFLFGFSRGAYTARSLAGMIAICGLPTQNFDANLINTAFEAYRNKDQRAALLATLGKYGMYDAKLTMVGVWDTVGSLGIPSLFGGVAPLLYGFLDTSLHPDVLNAYQALAIDERRIEFPPTLWTGSTAPGQVLKQIWFCGCHSDVGGGVSPGAGDGGTTLSDITLGWMMQHAVALGAEIAPAVLAQYAMPLGAKYALDEIHESWTVLFGFPCPRTIAPTSNLSNSVVVRCQNGPQYHPSNLTLANSVPAASYTIDPIVG
jgi:uncharacterized protein (DUF2235 family)